MFRKSLLPALTAVLALGLASAGRAQLIVSDGFDYAPGPITGDNGGTGWANAWTSSSSTNTDQVTSGGLTFSRDGVTLATSGNKLSTVGGDVGAYRQPPTVFGLYGNDNNNPTNNQDIWIGFLTRSTGTNNTGYGGLSLFIPGSTEQFFIGETQGSGHYGFQNLSTAAVQNAEGDAQSTGTVADGTTHFLVTDLNFSASGETFVTLYVDPTPGSAVEDPSQPGHFIPASYADSATFAYQTSFQFGEFRFQSGSGADVTFDMDELRMGSTYLDVSPVLAPAPEPGGLMTAFLGVGSLLAAAAWRRRRPTPA